MKIKPSIRRITSVFLTIIMLVTFMVPASAMGFDDLADVVDVTDLYGDGADYDSPGLDEDEADPDPWDRDSDSSENSSSNPDTEDNSDDAEPAELNEDDAATPTQLPLGSSGDIYTPLPEDSGVIYMGANGRAPMASAGPNNIYYTADWSVTHVWPFSGGTTTYPIYKFYTGSGETAYCIEPYKFNSQLGHAVTGEMTYSSLSAHQKTQIAKASEANSAGHGNTRMYAAAQTIIWEICAGQSHRSGAIYNAVITKNGLSSEYESIMSAMQNLGGEIPSFMSSDRNNPQVHQMQEVGGTWTATLNNTNSNVSFSSSDFITTAALNFNASGNTLTVTSSQEPGSDSFVEWSSGDGGGGIIFWVNATIQDKATVNFVPGTGYMSFHPDTIPPPPPEEPEPKIGYLTVYKYDGTNNLPLGGAIFRIECEGFLNEGWVVPYGGDTITIPIPEGQDSVEVTVTEVSSPQGYKLSGESKTVTVFANEIKEMSEVAFDNYPLPAKLTIYKYSKGNYSESLAGARFRVRVFDGSTLIFEDTAVTDSSGRITWEFPRGGWVELEELEPPPGHQMGDETFWSFAIENDEVKTWEVSNDKNAELIVYKRDSVDHTYLASAVFTATLLRSHTEPEISGIVYTETTDSSGKAHFTNLIPGEYRVEEQAPPPFYLPSNRVETVSIYDGSVETVTLTWENDRYSGLSILKVDSTDASKTLAGAVFSLYKGTEAHPTDFLGEYKTNENGMIVIQNLESNQWYTVVESQPPFGYALDPDNVRTVYLKPEDLNQVVPLIYRNPPLPKLLIVKEDEEGNRLPNAVFRLSKEGSIDYIDVQTGDDGTVLVENLEADVTYELWEIRAPDNHVLITEHRFIKLEVGKTNTQIFVNKHLPKFTLRKVNAYDENEGLDGITFKITRQDDGSVQYFTTQNGGLIEAYFEPGWITVEETHAPGFVLDPTPRQYLVDRDIEIVLTNIPRPTVTIEKICSVTKQPLKAGFTVKIKDGRELGTFWTDEETGTFTLDDELLGFEDFPLHLEITETFVPDGYLVTQEKLEITLEAGQKYTYQWENTPENPILIYKRDPDGQPVKGASFTVTTVEGTLVGHYKSGVNGYAVVAGVKPGWYLVRETAVSSDEFILDQESQLVELKYGSPAYCEFVNHYRPQIEILKLSAGDNPTPLQGVLMRVERLTGELIGDYRTDHEGKIHLQIDPGFVRIYELETISGFSLDPTPQILEVGADGVYTVTFYNKSLPGYMLQKICSVNKTPLSGVKYSITRLDGGIIGTGIYETDEQGIIYLELDEPYIVVTEVATKEGYRLSTEPRTIQLTPNELYIDKWENTPYPILELVKENQDGEPLANVKFRLYDQYMREVGVYTTNNLGRIVLSGMTEGRYFIQEYATSGPEYVLDRTVREISLRYGQVTTLRLVNEKTGNVKIRKVSAEDGKPLSGATYLIYDDKNNVLFERTTDAYGWFTLENMEPQRIYLREIKSPSGFVLDENLYGPYEIPSGGTLEIPLKNEPERGRIQIIKVAAEDSPINKIKKGDGLQNAKFEVFDEELNLVDVIKTDKRGFGTSDYLPLGRYALKEVASPEFFYSDGGWIFVEVKLHNDLIRLTVENMPEDIEVEVEKRGIVECMPGDVIQYDFSNIRNASNCDLDEFYWSDTLPVDALRIQSLNTGTWNQRVKYDVYIQTNIKTSWRKIESNLQSNVDHTINLSSTALKLASNEYVTSYKLVFGEVGPDFHEVKAPFITCKVLEGLPDGYRFVNRTEVGGRRGKEWVYQKDSWVTVVFVGKKCLPKTGI